MRDTTKTAMQRFYGSRWYKTEHLEEDYLAEIARYDNTLETWDAPKRAARLSAAVKRYKTSEMLRFIFDTVAKDPDPELTPITVKRLCNELFGRTGSQWLIIDVFGDKKRLQRSPDSNVDSVRAMASMYRNEARKHWQETLTEIKRVQANYKRNIKSAREHSRNHPQSEGDS